MSPLSKRATVYFDPAIHRAMKIKAAETTRSISDIVDEALRRELAEDAHAVLGLIARLHGVGRFDHAPEHPILQPEHAYVVLDALIHPRRAESIDTRTSGTTRPGGRPPAQRTKGSSGRAFIVEILVVAVVPRSRRRTRLRPARALAAASRWRLRTGRRGPPDSPWNTG